MSASDCSVELKWKGGIYLFGSETRLNGLSGTPSAKFVNEVLE